MPSLHRLKKIAHHIPYLGIFSENRRLRTDNGILQLEKGHLEAEIRKLSEDPRALLAQYYISGDGIEIGAAQFPVRLPANAKVRYVDLFSSDEIRRIWPIYKKLDIVNVDIVDDAEKLAKFKNNSLDFIIANHFIEHCLDPIGTIITMNKKLRKDGILFFAIPDKRYTFDKKRPLTPYKHLLEEHKDKTNKFLRQHTEEFFTLGEPVKKSAFEKKVQETIDSGFRIHYHVWTIREMIEMFTRINNDFELHLEIQAIFNQNYEVIFLLRKLK